MKTIAQMVEFIQQNLTSDELMQIEASVMQGENALASLLSTTQRAGKDILSEVYPLLDSLLRGLARASGYPQKLSVWSDDSVFQAILEVFPNLINSKWYFKRHGELKGF